MMRRICFITAFSVFCTVLANSEKCKKLTDLPVDIPAENVFKIAEDSQNVTKHSEEFVVKLREFIKNGSLPTGYDVKYYFFTSENPKRPIELAPTKGIFTKISYNKNKPLAFGIHGYDPKTNLNHGLIGELVKAVVELNKYNVLFVDYTKLIEDLLSVAVPRSYLAAKDMAKFLQFLMDETGTKREQIHIIGISLGGQMAGMIGHFLPGIGRISALDPGGSFFKDFPKDLRLDRSDANFVDVIHTGDAYPLPKGWGYYEPCGHLDFYPNGGLFQPGCNSTIPIEETPTTKEEISARLCMHSRMFIYYIESMCGNCLFVGTMCESYEKYKKGLCTASNSRTAIMGEFATKPLVDLPENAMFFLNTNDHYPFCKHQQTGQNCYSFFAPLTFFWSLFK